MVETYLVPPFCAGAYFYYFIVYCLNIKIYFSIKLIIKFCGSIIYPKSLIDT